MNTNIKALCKSKGFKLSMSDKGFTSKGYKYRIQEYSDNRTLMYAHTVKEVMFLITSKRKWERYYRNEKRAA